MACWDNCLELLNQPPKYVAHTAREKNMHIIFLWIAFLFDLAIFIGVDIGEAPNGPIIDGIQFKGWHFVFMTYWGGITQTIFFGYSILYHYLYSGKQDEKNYKYHLDRFFTFIFILSSFIGIFFWTLLWPSHQTQVSIEKYGFNKVFFNSVVGHGTTTLFVFVESLLRHHTYRSCISEVGIIYAFMGIYLAWNIGVYYMNNDWVYSIEGKFSPGMFVVFVLVIMLFVFFLYWVQRLFVSYYWSSRTENEHEFNSELLAEEYFTGNDSKRGSEYFAI